jgi:hypothetical protein
MSDVSIPVVPFEVDGDGQPRSARLVERLDGQIDEATFFCHSGNRAGSVT